MARIVRASTGDATRQFRVADRDSFPENLGNEGGEINETNEDGARENVRRGGAQRRKATREAERGWEGTIVDGVGRRRAALHWFSRD